MTATPRIAVGGIFHETNTFAADVTDIANFHAYQYASGIPLLDMERTRSEMGGFIEGLAHSGSVAVPTTYAAAVPSGTVRHSAYSKLREEILGGIDRGKVDAVLLALHGAMVTDGEDDPDGDLVSSVVELVGPGVPVVVTVDLHANVSDRMTAGVDAVIAYDTYPHVDMYERGREAVDVVNAVLRTQQRRVVRHRKLPLLTAPAMQATASTPMCMLFSLVHRLEAESGVQLSLTPGFAYADVDSAGCSVIGSGTDVAAVEQAVDEVARAVIDRQTEFVYEAMAVDEACRVAAAAPAGPVILVDAADNIGGGSPGDGTELLRHWLDAGYQGLVATIADPVSAERAIRAGVGSQVSLRLGAVVDDQHGAPLEVRARVLRVTDGTYTHTGSYNRGYRVSMGPTAVVDIGGNTIVVSTSKAMPFDAEQLRSQGVDPATARAIVVKSAVAWRAAYGDVAAQVLEVDTPGICSSNLARFDWSPERRAMLPPSQRAPRAVRTPHSPIKNTTDARTTWKES